MENHLPQSMCLILLLEDGRFGAAPGLPGYVRNIDGVAIGPEVGISCVPPRFPGSR